VVDEVPLALPVGGRVADVNPDASAALARMAAGPTGSYLLIVRPANPNQPLPESLAR
jgi:hypothetical protein